jgi:hypothetical protein
MFASTARCVDRPDLHIAQHAGVSLKLRHADAASIRSAMINA